MGISEHQNLLTPVVNNVKYGIGVTLNDTIFTHSRVASFVLWRTGTHQSMDPVKSAHFCGKLVHVFDERLESELFWETIFNHISKSQMHFA